MVPDEVRAGAAFLDERFGPEWVELVNLDVFDIDSGCNCIAAQVIDRDEGNHVNAWEHAMFRWGIIAPDEGDPDITTVAHARAKELGFLALNPRDPEAVGASWEDLDAGWRELIAERIAARAS